MSGTRELRQRMRSVGQTLKLTEAMRLISTSRLRKARRALSQSVPYFKAIRSLMEEIALEVDPEEALYFDDGAEKPGKRSGIIVVSGDRGMAGGFHHNVIALAEGLCQGLENPFLLMVGSLATRYFVRTRVPILEDFKSKSDIPSMELARRIGFMVLSQYRRGLIDEFHIVYTRMHSAVKIEPEILKLMPIPRSSLRKGSGARGSLLSGSEAPAPAEPGLMRLEMDFEPSLEETLKTLVPQYIEGVIYAALVESYASEQSSRMTAMDAASKNARDMLDALALKYNRARQAIITAEVSEIVSGAAALG